jgi:hypothetical protein
LTFFSQNTPITYFIFLKKSKTKNQKKKKKREKYVGVAKPPLGLGVAEPPLGQTGWPATPVYIYILDFYFLKIKYVMEAFWKNKKVKVVELSQFESFED